MPRPAEIDVVVAFGALGEAGQTAALAERPNAIAPAGEDLVRIGLMAHVPDQPVVRCIENRVQRHGEFDDPKAGAQMSAGDRNRVHRLAAQLVRHLAKLVVAKLTEIGGGPESVEQGGSNIHYQDAFARDDVKLMAQFAGLGCFRRKKHAPANPIKPMTRLSK
jgi:hypothetical protein